LAWRWLDCLLEIRSLRRRKEVRKSQSKHLSSISIHLVAQKTKNNAKAVASYILASTLPAAYRTPTIMPPSIVGSAAEEAEYVALCSIIVSLISLSPSQQIANAKFESMLDRLNCSKNMGTLDSTSNVLKRMQRDGYIFKSVDRGDGEEQILWIVGPRGKVEIGNKGVMGMVQEVYGEEAPDDLDKRLKKSLGLDTKEKGTEVDGDLSENGDPGPSTQKQKKRKPRRAEVDD